MKLIIVFAAVLALAIGAPQQLNPQLTTIVKELPNNNIGLDSYQYSYELSDGQHKEESAQVETRGPEDAILRVKGSFAWVDPATNQQYTVSYIADENGFQPQGAHIPA